MDHSDMVEISAGRFLMGSTAFYAEETPVRDDRHGKLRTAGSSQRSRLNPGGRSPVPRKPGASPAGSRCSCGDEGGSWMRRGFLAPTSRADSAALPASNDDGRGAQR